jgi:PadR family transcriptional regulator, regulatory protein PadR
MATAPATQRLQEKGPASESPANLSEPPKSCHPEAQPKDLRLFLPSHSIPGVQRTTAIRREPATKTIGIDASDFFAIIEVMTNRSYLGEFELMLLLAMTHLGEEAYGVPISRQLELHRGRNVSVGSVYAALERLEAKGLVNSNLGDPTPERGGKAKRYFRITKEGLRQVRETRRVLTNLWRTIPELKLESSREG